MHVKLEVLTNSLDIGIIYQTVTPPRGGQQIILNVAVTGVTGQSRRTDSDTDSPLEYRFSQKMAKYAQVAQDNDYFFIPAIFSHTGQIHKKVMDLMSDQIKHKLQLDDPQVIPM